LVRPAYRSRSRKRIIRRVPSGEARVYFKKRRNYEARCAICGKPLGGVPKDYNIIRWGSKTEKRPERYFGGVICPSCLATALKLAIRGA